MKKHCSLKFNVYYSTIIFLFLSIFYGSFINIFLFYLMTLIHELGHLFFALLFKLKCNYINFHPLGFSLDIENMAFLTYKKQILILLGGPMMFFVNWLIIYILFKLDFISIYLYRMSLENNMSLLIFNLIPFYPLDGGRILEITLFNFFDVFKTKLINLFISSFISIGLLTLCVINGQWILFLFILYSLFCSIILFNKNYNEYLFSRVGNTNKFESKIVEYPKIYHFKYNYIYKDNRLINEEYFIFSKKIKIIAKK